ncbi:MAG: efflux RND transporter periplasmic adaptor subunit [Deltaproteobacteria bacterium]|nr:efflux RND transporter periplasmic adaptor subunit [Deltaproteobacteria bacterium]
MMTKKSPIFTAKRAGSYLAVSLAFFLLSSCKAPVAPPQAEAPLAVRTLAVRSGSIRETIRYIGTVHSQNEIKVLARVAGRASRLPVKEGEKARRGAAIAYIAAPEMDARVSRLHAEVSRANKESAYLCQQAETDGTLLASKAISKWKSDASRQKCESSRAALMAAEAGLNELTVLAGNTVERAPFEGKVLLWLTEPGENLMPGRPILIFGDEALEVRVAVHEKDIGAAVKTGTQVILFPDHPAPIRAKVAFVAPMVAGPGRMVEVRVPVSKEDAQRFRHGASIDVDFVVHEKPQALLVPSDAVDKKKSGFGVYFVQNDVATWKEVVPSIRNRGWIAIESGLKAGDLVVAGNLDALQDGMVVYPVKSERSGP